MRLVHLFLLTVLCVCFQLHAAETLTFEVDAAKRTPISPYIYGHNHPDWKQVRGITLLRSGGNRMTAYNWETNASNAGSDWQHQNDSFLGGGETPGEVVRASVAGAQEHNASIVITVPCIGYVAADKKGGGDVNKTPDYLKTRFLASLPSKGKPFVYPPDLTDGQVYQDEFVAWLEQSFPAARKDPAKTIFYCLDNEPDLWASTHARIHPDKLRFDELAKINAQYTEAIKHAAPQALVFGFVSYGWHGMATLQDAPDRNNRDFIEFYLQEMKAAEAKAKKRLVDVLDIHWYPEARGGNQRITEDDHAAEIAAARIQAPRSLWDPAYKEVSWIAQHATQGPIRLLPRLREKIEKCYPGTKLAITEYYFGGGEHISGALAQADVLGIFGREGLFAAALWHLGKTDDRFIYAAFSMYRDYDGKGGCFGDSSLSVSGGDPAKASLYASVDAKNRLVLVAINKTAEPLSAHIKLNGAAVKAAAVYRLTEADTMPAAQGETKAQSNGNFKVELPAYSVTTLAAKE